MLAHLAASHKSVLGFALALAMLVPLGAAQGERYDVLYSFTGGSDGSDPLAGVIADSAGNLYGTTSEGGDFTNCTYGCGTVFKLAPDGTETVLYAFAGKSDGDAPFGGLIMDAAGDLYGTTWGGGSADCSYCGTVFKLAPDGTHTVLYAFENGSDGAHPYAGVILDKAGNLYGTTANGGGSDNCTDYCGTVFRVAPDGTETVLYAFQGERDGTSPTTSLIVDNKGNLFGTTELGGDFTNCRLGCGTVFRVKPDGTETVLYAFTGESDGSDPEASLIRDKQGNLYGTTMEGGESAGCCGTVFELAPDGTETVLHAFTDGSDGGFPTAGLIMDKQGNLYGTTTNGGNTAGCTGGCGTAFRLAPDGTVTTLYDFKASPPSGNLLRIGHLLYGTRNGHRPHVGGGAVYSLKD